MSDKKAVYGYCPKCGAPGMMRSRCRNGDDICEKGCRYKSKSALPEPPKGPTMTDDTCKRKGIFTTMKKNGLRVCPQCGKPVKAPESEEA